MRVDGDRSAGEDGNARHVSRRSMFAVGQGLSRVGCRAILPLGASRWTRAPMRSVWIPSRRETRRLLRGGSAPRDVVGRAHPWGRGPGSGAR
jgi:hypothetical protein